MKVLLVHVLSCVCSLGRVVAQNHHGDLVSMAILLSVGRHFQTALLPSPPEETQPGEEICCKAANCKN